MNKILVIHESKKDSIIKDGVTFGSMFILLMVNHLFLGGRLAIDLFFLAMIIAWLLAKNSPAAESFNSIDDAQAYLVHLEMELMEHEDDRQSL